MPSENELIDCRRRRSTHNTTWKETKIEKENWDKKDADDDDDDDRGNERYVRIYTYSYMLINDNVQFV